MKVFTGLSAGKLKIGGSFDLIGLFFCHPIHKNVGNLSELGVHTSNCVKNVTKNNLMQELNHVNRP